MRLILAACLLHLLSWSPNSLHWADTLPVGYLIWGTPFLYSTLNYTIDPEQAYRDRPKYQADHGRRGQRLINEIGKGQNVMFVLILTATCDPQTSGQINPPGILTGNQPLTFRQENSKTNIDQSIERTPFRLPVSPYPFQQRPKYRYPYYDKDGKGKLLYGYGDENQLFEYKNFVPLEGYF